MHMAKGKILLGALSLRRRTPGIRNANQYSDHSIHPTNVPIVITGCLGPVPMVWISIW